MPIFVGFKMKPLRTSIFLYQDKSNSKFAVKLAERNNGSFSVYVMKNLSKTSVLFNM